MRKRRILTVDECMSMSYEELSAFLEEDEKLLSEGIGDRSQPNVDFQGMTIQDIAKKYGCIPMEEAFANIMKKLGSN